MINLKTLYEQCCIPFFALIKRLRVAMDTPQSSFVRVFPVDMFLDVKSWQFS